ncbi:hypothetical protein [Burkholderia sp. Bp8963]|uniref:hypothetical protein n=1 Tax=Burkholderia sp. Bp8963 TaxID=2184547 RepID=UPI000F5A28D0|nr:hypothetical protein [Burkholderia sp. Bp8963]
MNNVARTIPGFRYWLVRSIDRISWQKWSLWVAAFAVAGCTSLAPAPDTTASSNPPQSRCVGTIEPPYGLEQTSNPALLGRAVGQTDKGGLCEGNVFKVTQPLTVYRVWDSSKTWSQYGNWWSFNPPAGPTDTYRAKNEICPSWSRLDRVTQCRLKVGAEIVIGPGQSAQCGASDSNISYPPSPETQVFVPNDGAVDDKRSVTDCLAEIAWP